MERNEEFNKKRITISIEEYLQRRQKKDLKRNEEQKEESSAQLWAELYI